MHPHDVWSQSVLILLCRIVVKSPESPRFKQIRSYEPREYLASLRRICAVARSATISCSRKGALWACSKRQGQHSVCVERIKVAGLHAAQQSTETMYLDRTQWIIPTVSTLRGGLLLLRMCCGHERVSAEAFGDKSYTSYVIRDLRLGNLRP